MATREERLGKATLRWQRNGDGTYSGVAISSGKRSDVLHDEEEARLRTRLRNQAGILEPNYFGIEAAIERFLEFMPGGFDGDRAQSSERQYKEVASGKLRDVLSLERAVDATPADAAVVRAASVWINLLSPYEAMHLKDALESPAGAAFLRSAAKFALGDVDAGAKGMAQAMGAHGRLSWPTATYFPFLWSPDCQMFLKPTVTCDFAQRIGHRFQYDYTPEIASGTYESLLDLADYTKRNTERLNPRDLLDIQSFIWVVGAYRDGDRPE